MRIEADRNALRCDAYKSPLVRGTVCDIRPSGHSSASAGVGDGTRALRRARIECAAIVMAAALVGSGCAATSRTTGIDPEIAVSSSPRLTIRSVRATGSGADVIVSGSVQRPALSVGRIGGHLHVVARFNDGGPPVTGAAHWGSISHRGSRIAYFRTRLAVGDPSRVTAITVSHTYRSHAEGVPGHPASSS